MSVVRLGEPRDFKPTGREVVAPCIGGCGRSLRLGFHDDLWARIWLDVECKYCAAEALAEPKKNGGIG